MSCSNHLPITSPAAKTLIGVFFSLTGFLPPPLAISSRHIWTSNVRLWTEFGCTRKTNAGHRCEAYLTHTKCNVPLSHCVSLPGSLTVGLVQQCQTIHGRDRNCIPPQLPPEWITTLFFIIMGVVSLTATCFLMVMSRWRREATRYARWIAFTGSRCSLLALLLLHSSFRILK